jgi:hypothetical protein
VGAKLNFAESTLSDILSDNVVANRSRFLLLLNVLRHSNLLLIVAFWCHQHVDSAKARVAVFELWRIVERLIHLSINKI